MLCNDLKSWNQWLADNKLALHLGKTECILFGSTRKSKSCQSFHVQYEDHVIKCSKDIKYLGVVTDQSLSGETKATNVISKVSNKLKFMYRHKSCLNLDLTKRLSASNPMSYRLLLFYLVPYIARKSKM